MLPDGAFLHATTPGAALAQSMNPGGNAGRPPLSLAKTPPRESAAAVAQPLAR
jgi:hypothetical protein